MTELDEIRKILTTSFTKWWGYEKFRSNQLDACANILQGKDTLMIAATGSGKSVAYQLPSLALRDNNVKATTIVISPLLSLIEDQIMSLSALGISAVSISSNSSARDEQSAMNGDYAILYMTPEKIVRWTHGIAQLCLHSHIICLGKTTSSPLTNPKLFI